MKASEYARKHPVNYYKQVREDDVVTTTIRCHGWKRSYSFQTKDGSVLNDEEVEE